MQTPKMKLNNGIEIPSLGYGTFLSKPGEIGPALKCAIEVGYRHIDCALAYDNQVEIGNTLAEILAEGKVKREDLFITSKVKAGGMVPSEIQAQLELTLGQLQLSYLDLYLIHQPISVTTVNDNWVPLRKQGWGLQDIWREMEKLYDSGKVRAIGVSNFSVIVLNDLLCYARIPPVVNQVERHPFLQQPKLVDFCKKEGLAITAYSPLGASGLFPDNPTANLLKNETITKIARQYGKKPSQVLIRWSIDSGVIAIPKSIHPERIKENFDIWDFKLSSADIEEIAKLDTGRRSFEQDWMGVPLFH